MCINKQLHYITVPYVEARSVFPDLSREIRLRDIRSTRPFTDLSVEQVAVDVLA